MGGTLYTSLTLVGAWFAFSGVVFVDKFKVSILTNTKTVFDGSEFSGVASDTSVGIGTGSATWTTFLTFIDTGIVETSNTVATVVQISVSIRASITSCGDFTS